MRENKDYKNSEYGHFSRSVVTAFFIRFFLILLNGLTLYYQQMSTSIFLINDIFLGHHHETGTLHHKWRSYTRAYRNTMSLDRVSKQPNSKTHSGFDLIHFGSHSVFSRKTVISGIYLTIVELRCSSMCSLSGLRVIR